MSTKNSNPTDALYTIASGPKGEKIDFPLTVEDMPVVYRHSAATYGNDLRDSPTVRGDYTKRDFEAKRPSYTFPTTQREIFDVCEAIYRRVGMVHNIIDIMTDFAVEGVSLAHPNKDA